MTAIILPIIRQEGFDAMLRGKRMHSPGNPMGFTFCPYQIGSTERDNFLVGCEMAIFIERTQEAA